jgi:hypothetical protein
MEVEISKLYGEPDKIKETARDIDQGRISRSVGSPITVSRLDSPRGCFYLMDGYHRTLEAARRGERTIAAALDRYMPRIERTGGAFSGMVARKVSISKALDILGRDKIMENNHKSATDNIKKGPASRASRLKRRQIRTNDDQRLKNLGENRVGPFSEWMKNRVQRDS